MSEEATKSIATKQILIADDMDSMRNVITSSLREVGFTRVHAVVNGAKAMSYMKSNPVDILLCDWDMPDLSGIEVLQTIREDDNLKHIIFIMVTAADDPNSIKTAIDAGVNDYIVKPFTPNQIVYRVLKQLRKLK